MFTEIGHTFDTSEVPQNDILGKVDKPKIPPNVSLLFQKQN